MSEASASPPGKPPARTRLVFKIALVLVVVMIALLYLPVFFMAGQAGVMGAVALGWWRFLNRTIPAISWNWDIVGMSALCLLLVVLLAHGFFRWITKSIASTRGRNWRWPWKWTACGLVGLVLLFLVGMAVGGAAHQIGWLLGSNEAWYEQKPRHLGDLMKLDELEREFRAVLQGANTVDAMRQAMSKSNAESRWRARGEESPIQSCHILFALTNGGIVNGAIIFPREARARSKLGGYYTTQSQSVPVPADQLPALLKQHGDHLLAF